MKMVKRKAAGSDRLANGVDTAGSSYVGSGPEHAMYFDLKDVMDLAVDGVSFGDQSKGVDGNVTPESVLGVGAHCLNRKLIGLELPHGRGHLRSSDGA